MGEKEEEERRESQREGERRGVELTRRGSVIGVVVVVGLY